MPWLEKIYHRIHYSAATLYKYLDEEGAAKLRYRLAYGKWCDLEHPETFSEKLLWLMFHTYRNNRVILECCDKFLVRNYVEANGCGDTLNTLYGRWTDVEDIPWSKLPDNYVLKMSLGCGKNIYCRSRSSFDTVGAKKQLRKWMKNKPPEDTITARIGGVPPKGLPKSIICEKYLADENGIPPVDYKIYCFNGKPIAMLVIGERFGDTGGCFMDTEWNLIEKVYDGKFYTNENFCPGRPRSLERMISAAKALSKPFPFVRVDFYDYKGSCVFGELTFFPAGCIHVAECKINGEKMGEVLDISYEIKSEPITHSGYKST